MKTPSLFGDGEANHVAIWPYKGTVHINSVVSLRYIRVDKIWPISVAVDLMIRLAEHLGGG
jgi:hypothetical protein